MKLLSSKGEEHNDNMADSAWRSHALEGGEGTQSAPCVRSRPLLRLQSPNREDYDEARMSFQVSGLRDGSFCRTITSRHVTNPTGGVELPIRCPDRQFQIRTRMMSKIVSLGIYKVHVQKMIMRMEMFLTWPKNRGRCQITKTRAKEGLRLDDSQKEVIPHSWRSQHPDKLSAYREGYKTAFPVDESCDDIFQVPTLEGTV